MKEVLKDLYSKSKPSVKNMYNEMYKTWLSVMLEDLRSLLGTSTLLTI